MMRQLTGLIVAVAISLPPLSAADTVLPGPDALGLYFDAEARSIDLTLLAPGSYQVNLILTRPTMSSLTAWQTAFAIAGNASVAGMELPGGATVVANGPVDFGASMATPMPAAMMTKLAVFTVVSSTLENATFYLGAVGAPAVVGNLPCVQVPGATWMAVGVASGDPARAVASVTAQTANQSASWGQVKSLFR